MGSTTDFSEPSTDGAQAEAARALEDLVGHSFASPISAILLAAQAIERAPENGNLSRTIVRAARQLHRMTLQADVLVELAVTGALRASGAPGLLGPSVRAAARDACVRSGCEFVCGPVADLDGQWDVPRVALIVDTLAALAAMTRLGPGPVGLSVTDAGSLTAQICLRVVGAAAVESEISASFDSPLTQLRRGYWGESLGTAPFVARAMARAHGGDIRIERDGDVLVFEVVLRSASPA